MAIAILAAMLAGCASQTTQNASQTIQNTSQITQNTSQTTQITAPTVCTAKDCFIAAANNCSDISIQATESFGTVKYSTSGCVFTKTIISLNQNESADMRAALTGKSLTCVYEKNKFDSGLLTSLVIGIENCDGELKEIISQLVLFS